MARLFDNASSQYLNNAAALVTAYPWSFSGWFYSDDAAQGSQTLFSIGDISVTDQFWQVFLGVSGVPTFIRFRSKSGPSNDADTTIAWVANTWHHVLAVATSATSRAVYLDGGSKGTNTTPSTPSGVDETRISRLCYSSDAGYFSGRLAEFMLWNAALTDDDAVSLATGISPISVKLQSGLAYWPLMGNLSPEPDWLENKYNMTLNNGPTKGDHPPVMYPALLQNVHVPTVAAADVIGPFPTFLPS